MTDDDHIAPMYTRIGHGITLDRDEDRSGRVRNQTLIDRERFRCDLCRRVWKPGTHALGDWSLKEALARRQTPVRRVLQKPLGRLTSVVRTQVTGKNNRRVLKVVTTHAHRAG